MASSSPGPAGLSGDATATPTPASANGTDSKRKAEPNSGNRTRSKRNRYISLACNECKRRKIKCNGQVPCQRCGHLSLECLYAPNCCNSNFKDTDEFRSMKTHIEELQTQVNTLFANINDLHQKADSSTIDGSQINRDISQPLPGQQQNFDSQGLQPAVDQQPKHPRFHGPTSAAFNFDVAKSSLRTMGITQPDDGHDLFTTQDATPSQTPPSLHSPFPLNPAHPSKDPLWVVRRDEAIRLLRVYEEEIGLMYPFIDIEKMIGHTNLLYTFLEAADRTGFAKRFKSGADCLSDDESCILKMILAITLVVEGNGQSPLGAQFFAGAKRKLEDQIWKPGEISTIKLLTLMATYHFHTDNEIMAYRLIGLAARMCLEMGLHRRDAIMKAFNTEEDLVSVNKIFWSVYCLDRRWCFGTGLPFVIQDEDIDPCLSDPSDSVPYLKAMVLYCRISSKVWYAGLGAEGSTNVKRDKIGFLDYQVLQWVKNIPEPLKLYPIEQPRNQEPISRGIRRLRLVLYIRGNHLRILIYRPVLHSATSIMENMACAQTVVDIAKNTIRVLTELNQTSDIYRSQQVLFNYFLVAALAVLFLAVSHAPMEFNRQVRDEFFMALDLVRGMSTKSYVSKRLWKMIKGLREIGEKLGLLPRTIMPNSTDPHSTAAVAMAGLAGHPMDVIPYGVNNTEGALGNSPMNGLQMSNELTNLFEVIGGYSSYNMHHTPGSEGLNGDGGEFVTAENNLQATTSGEVIPPTLGNEGEFSRVMQDLF